MSYLRPTKKIGFFLSCWLVFYSNTSHAIKVDPFKSAILKFKANKFDEYLKEVESIKEVTPEIVEKKVQEQSKPEKEDISKVVEEEVFQDETISDSVLEDTTN